MLSEVAVKGLLANVQAHGEGGALYGGRGWRIKHVLPDAGPTGLQYSGISTEKQGMCTTPGVYGRRNPRTRATHSFHI